MILKPNIHPNPIHLFTYSIAPQCCIRLRRLILDRADQSIWLSKASQVLWVAWEFFTEKHPAHALLSRQMVGLLLFTLIMICISAMCLHLHTYFGSRWGSGGFPGGRRRRRPQVWKDPTSSGSCSLPAFSCLPGKTDILSFTQKQNYGMEWNRLAGTINIGVSKKKKFSYRVLLKTPFSHLRFSLTRTGWMN